MLSPISVIVVAVAAISGFTLPNRDMDAALRLLRFGMVLLAVFLGMFGLMLGLALIIWHLSTFESFGVPYTAPMSGGGLRAWMKSLLRLPLPEDKYRPRELRTPDRRNQG